MAPSSWAANTSHKFLRLPNEVIFRYNAYDAYNTAHLFLAMRQELQDLPSQWDYYSTWVQPLQQAVMAMQQRGILLDKPKKHAYHIGLRRELTATDKYIQDYATATGFTFNDKFPNSTTQASNFLFDHLHLKSYKKTPSGKRSVDQDALTRVLRNFRKKDEPHRQLLYQLFHRARLQTILTRYMTIPTGTDSRCRPTVKITGTKTFRYAYADPALQQYPPEIRHLFQAKPGCVFIAADYSQLEARILAYLSRDAISIEAFTQNEDVHAQNARDLFGFTLDYWQRLEPTKKKAHRNFAKSFLYRISYGGEGQTDKSKTYCPCDKCQQYQPQSLNLKRNEILTSEARWFATHHWVRTFQDNLCRSVQQNHYYDSPFGLRRWISKPWGNDLRREVLNVPMQMNAALLMNQSQVLLHKMGLPIILQIHDAFMVEVPDNSSVIEQCIADMVGVMERPIEAFGGAVFPVDVEVGQNWGSNSMENPNGLKGVEVNGE